jgi:hypothetical protein
LKRGGDRSKAQNCALTHAQAAERFSVSERQVDRASALLKAEAGCRAAAELMEQVRNGKIPLSRAEKLMHLTTAQQREVVTQNDGGTDLQPGKRKECRSWSRQFDEMVSETERLCTRMTYLIARADDAGELMPEHRQRLREAWQKAPRWLFVDAQYSEEIPSAPYFMPFDEA